MPDKPSVGEGLASDSSDQDPPLLDDLPLVPYQSPAPAPVEDPVWSGGDVVLIAVTAFVAMLVLQFAVLYAAREIAFPRLSLNDIAQKPIVLLISQVLIYIPVAACMFLLVAAKYQVPFWRAIRWNWPHPAWTPLGGGVVLFVLLALVQNFLPMPKDTPFEHLFDRPRDAYLLSLIAVTLGPLMEELFFRGFMYPVIARRIGVFWGIALTALPFGLIHLPQYGWAWGAALVVCLVGVACGAVRATTKSVAASFLVHAGYNGAQMVIAVVMTHGFRNLDKA